MRYILRAGVIFLVSLFVASIASIVPAAVAAPPDESDAEVTAPPSIPDTVKLDGVTYTRYEVVATFLKAAISTHIPVNQTRTEATLIPPFKTIEETDNALSTPEGYRVQYPWLYEYMYREKGMPRYAAINKWDSSVPVRVALGFPNDLKPYEWLRLPIKNGDNKTQANEPVTYVESVLYEQSAKTPDSKVVAIVESEIKSIAEILSEITGLSVSFMDRDQETAAQVAPIRIILTTQEALPPLKHGRKITMTSGGVVSLPNKNVLQFRGQLEQFYLPTAVTFTPYSDKQADGYFFPNADNTIGLSLCFIWQGHRPEMLKALVRECLLRSMGLPDATAIEPKGYLDLWNDPQKYPRWQKDSRGDTITVGDDAIPKQFSEHDRYFLRLLYNPALKPGMSAVDVHRALMALATKQ